MGRTRIIIMGDAGRGFHSFNIHFRDNINYDVIAFITPQTADGRLYPIELAGKFYPNGVPIYPENQLDYLITHHSVDQVIFAYDDIPHMKVMNKAAEVNALGADFRLMGMATTQIRSSKPVITVCATHAHSGKSLAARQVIAELQKLKYKVVVVRHPMSSSNLRAVKRFAEYEDLDTHQCTIEEREEYEPYLDRKIVVYTGADHAAILKQAEAEADLIVWDGGSNDLPFFVSDFHVVMADPHRVGGELNTYPGESNLRMAEVVIINYVDTANYADIALLRENIHSINSNALILEAAAPLSVIHPQAIHGKRVLVVENGIQNETGYGAGRIAAQRFRAAEMTDPRPFAVGSIAEVYANHPFTGKFLPVMGYSDSELHDLEQSINNSNADLVIAATPIDLKRVIHLNKPIERVRAELQVIGTPTLADLVREKYER